MVGPGQRQARRSTTPPTARKAAPAPSRSPPAPRSRAATAATATATCSPSTEASCKLYELYRAFYVAKPKPHWNADSGAAWDLDSAARRPEGWTSADAAGLPIFPGLVRYDEVAAGHLDHAIRVTFESTRDAWVHPAVHCAGDTANAAAPPMGLRLRLKAGYGLGRFSGPRAR